MATFLHQAQFPLLCQLCETEAKISWKCMDCNLLMCNRCKRRIHINIKNASTHEVIDTSDIGLHPEKPNFNNVPCKEHGGKVCVMFCSSCNQLICPPCISKIHKGHELVEISEGYRIQVQRLKVGKNKSRINIDHLITGVSKLRAIMKSERIKYKEARDRIQAQNIALKKAVDHLTDNLLKELDERYKELKINIQREENKVIRIKKEMTDKTKDTENIISSNDIEKMSNSASQFEKYLTEAEKPLEIKISSIPKFVPMDIGKSVVGSLEYAPKNITLQLPGGTSKLLQTKFGIGFQVAKEYETGISRIFHMSRCENTLWISNEDVIQKVRPTKKKLKVEASFNMRIRGMAITPSNDLLLVPLYESALKQISCDSEEITDTNYNINQLCLTAVHVTRDFKVVVGAREFGKPFQDKGRKIVVSMDRTGRHKTVYEYDSNNQPIFTFPWRVASTNGNICVIDTLFSNDRGRVVVLGKDGDVLNAYDGNATDINLIQPFKPAYIETTIADNIIVTDVQTQTLHILNDVGQLIKYIKTKEQDIEYPYSIVFSKRKVYIGCTGEVRSFANAKLYQVNLTGC